MFELRAQSEGHHSFELTAAGARFDGRLFGGAGLAAAVAALEAETARRALWATVQFVGTAELGEHVDCHVEVLADGHNMTQARVTATTGGRIVFLGLGSTARSREGGFGADLGTMPDVAGPERCETWMPALPAMPELVTARGPFATADLRRTAAPDGSMKLWARMKTGSQTRATLAYLGDFVPSAVLRAAGRDGGGTSLDNSIRFGPPPAAGTDWILIDPEPQMADSGYLHGSARLWSRDGRLLAVASQTAAAKLFD